jgi:hypothetical protein
VNRSLKRKNDLNGVIKYSAYDDNKEKYLTTVNTNASTEISVLKSIFDNIKNQINSKNNNMGGNHL